MVVKSTGTGKRKAKHKPQGFQVITPNVAGIDIGSREHWVCSPPRGEEESIRQFGSTTPELEELGGWLKSLGVESVAMESTSVYWIPVYELLESMGFKVVLVNSRQLANVPGRKTDLLDCQWIQRLHSCGLLKGSFRPEGEICELRAIQRECAEFVQQRTEAVQKMQKALDQMNVQVHRAVSDLTGLTGMKIVRAIVAGERNPEVLSQLRDPRCKKSSKEIAKHLTGTWREEHLFNLGMALRFYDHIEELIGCYETRLLELIKRLTPPDQNEAALPAHPNKSKHRNMAKRGQIELRTELWRFAQVDLTRIDGIGPGAAMVALTEVGPDVSAFPTENHFVSWLRLTPRMAISGGKPLKKKIRGTGATRLANVLRMAAVTLRHSKTALGAAYRRIAARKGQGMAVFAMARKLAILIYRMLAYGQDYVDEGMEVYEKRFADRRIRNLKHLAEELGFELTESAQPSG